MVCAVELGLIRPPTIVARPTTKRKSRFSGNRIATIAKPVRGSKRDSIVEKREVNSWLTQDRLFGETSSEEDCQNRRSLTEHQYSLPPFAKVSPENLTNLKAGTIFHNEEKKIGRKTEFHKSPNSQRTSTEDSRFFSRKFCSQNFDKNPGNDGTIKGFFENATRSFDEKSERRLEDAETFGSIGKIPQKRGYCLEQESSSSGKNAGNLDDVESIDEDSSVPEFPRLSSNFDIYAANRAIKNQTGPIDPISTDDDDDEVSESDVRGSPNFPSWKKMYLEPWERSKPKVVRKVVGKRRRRRRDELQKDKKKDRNFGKIRSSTSKKEDRNFGKIQSSTSSAKDEESVDGSKKENHTFGKIRTSTSLSPKAAAIKLTDPAIDSEGSEIDDSLLVDPSTDLPGALLESNDQTAINVDLNHRFDVNLDMNFSSHRQTTLNISTVDNEDSSKISSSDEEKSSAESSFLKRTRPKNRKNPKKLEKENSSLRIKKRRSADWSIIRSSSFDKENRNHYVDNSNHYAHNSIDEKKLKPKIGRLTRNSLKTITDKVTNDPTWPIGTVVWGNCSGWWPGIVVAAEDVGMPSSPGKSWIFWIGEHRISNLRDRTQIQSFSSNLRMRMIETLRIKTHRDALYSACLATAQLLNDLILRKGPLTRPHHAWVEKHLATRDDLDNFTLLPYPTTIQTRLDELRKTNFPATEKYLQELQEQKESSSSVQKVAPRSIAPENPGNLPLSDQKPGVITWAKIMGQTWWPAMIIDFRDCGMKPPNFGCQWILWYGDYTLSQVNHRFFLDFETGMRRMKDRAATSKREIYRRGVVEAAKDYCSRLGYRTEDWSLQDAFDWFSNLDDDDEMWTRSQNHLPGIPGNSDSPQQPYPQRIVDGLRKHKGNCTVAAIREHNIKDSVALRSVAKGKLDLVDLCLMCLKSNKKRDEKWSQHPFFEGSLCPDCSEKYTPTIFAYGDDGKCFFCTICAGSDTVVLCDEDDCPRVYCTACLKYLIAPKTYDDIMMTDPFHCFLCVNSPDLLSGGLLKPRDDWKTQVAGLFRGKRDSVPGHVENYYKDGKKRLRVLSLFDGISAGLVVLEKLGIHVDAYYASEISPDAEMVSSAHFGERIVRLGDVRSITEEKIREIAPIHLLIGGSPCNDLSLVNPMRRGLHDPNGTGVLVFEYRRVRNLVERANGDQHFFWMFENVASMPTKYRLEINEILGREPELIDAAHYSPQHRPRLYWSNFPVVSSPLSSQDLQDVLTKNCNRHALVKKIRTVTTRVNSLKQGKEALKPILMNDANDTLWITELEEIFGFPRHYTDVKNLCATKRQKLIGKSWSVQTISEIMRPLCNFFESRCQES